MFCQKCGTRALEDATFCNKCGAKLIKEEAPKHQNEPVLEVSPDSTQPSPSQENIRVSGDTEQQVS